VTGAWAQTELCSWNLSGVDNDHRAGTVSGTNCSVTYGNLESNSNNVTGTDGNTYWKFGSSCKVQMTLSSGSFKAGDIVTVKETAKKNKTIGFKLKSTSGNGNTGTTSSTTDYVPVEVSYTLIADDIESDGSIKIYRNSGDDRFFSFSVSRLADDRESVTLSFASSSGSADIAASATLPTLTVDPNVTAVTSNITYSSSNPAVATVTGNGALTLTGIGKTTITAAFAGDETYKPASATYTLTVTDATKLGYAEVINSSNNTLADRWTFGFDHASVAQTYANAIIDDGATVATLTMNGTNYTNTKSWRKTQNGYSVSGKDQWVGYDITVDDNYVLNLTHLDARILIADDTYKWYVEILDKNGEQVYKSTEQTTTKSNTANLSTDINVTNLNGTAKVKLWVTQGGTSKRFSIEKLILTGTTAEDTRPVRTITFAAGGGLGTVPANTTVREGETFFFPSAPLLYKTDNTLTDWNDGSADHEVGSSATISGDMDLTAVFTPNTVALGDVATTVDWTFKTSKGAPSIAIEGSGATPVVYSSRTTLGATPFDALMTIDATDGKFNNESTDNYAQVNTGTKFTIPAVKGMTVTVSCNQNPKAVSDVTFAGNNADAFSTNPRTLTYTYNGTESSIDIVVVNGGLYPDGISVAYPYVKTKYDAPTITVGDFNFENKGYEVTITASEGDLYVAEDGNDFIVKASPYTTYATATTHYNAQAKGSDYGDSDVADEQVENAFDGTKAYVAWVYESDYVNKPKNYNIANDEIYKGLAAEYNVVPVDIKDYKSAITDEQKTALNGNLDDADLVVLSEAAAGASKAVIAMKDLVGTVPMLNMKLFAYTYNTDASKNRWGWGIPQNLGTAVTDVTITPVSKYYKVLEGVTFDGDNVALFSYPNDDQNHIQYVDSWTAEPEGDVVLANVTVSETNKPAMHASTNQKYFALGLSCDDFGKYNANVVTLIKNAAAMLIAGEDLAAVTAVEGTIKANKEWITFCSTENLDFSSDITGLDGAYTITAHADKAITLTATKMTGAVKAGTGLLLRAAEKKDVDQVIAIPVAATGDEQTDNMLIGVTEDTDIQPTAGDYTHLGLSNGEFHPYSEAGTLAAGKAYLRILTAQMPTAGNNAKLIIVFDGEATGIANLNVNDNDNIDANAPMYNLAGQRVNKSYKGVVIVNGKKYINK